MRIGNCNALPNSTPIEIFSDGVATRSSPRIHCSFLSHRDATPASSFNPAGPREVLSPTVLPELTAKVAGAVENADQLDAVRDRPVEKNEFAHREAAKGRGKLVLRRSDQG